MNFQRELWKCPWRPRVWGKTQRRFRLSCWAAGRRWRAPVCVWLLWCQSLCFWSLRCCAGPAAALVIGGRMETASETTSCRWDFNTFTVRRHQWCYSGPQPGFWKYWKNKTNKKKKPNPHRSTQNILMIIVKIWAFLWILTCRKQYQLQQTHENWTQIPTEEEEEKEQIWPI